MPGFSPFPLTAMEFPFRDPFRPMPANSAYLQTLKLLRLRLEHRWDASASESSSSTTSASLVAAAQGTQGFQMLAAGGISGSGAASQAAMAAGVASAHTCPYTGVAAVRVGVYSPGEAWCGRGDWRYHLLNVANLDPYM